MHRLAYARPLFNESAAGLQSLFNRITKARQSLRTLELDVEHWHDWLVFFMTQGMDPITRKDWEKNLGDQQELPSFQAMSDFIGGRIRALQSSDDVKAGTSSNSRRQLDTPAARSRRCLATTASEERCPECKGEHRLYECKSLLSRDPRARLFIIRRLRLCFNCLRPNHVQAQCPSRRRCLECSSDHHTLLHSAMTKKRSGDDSLDARSNKRVRSEPAKSKPARKD